MDSQHITIRPDKSAPFLWWTATLYHGGEYMAQTTICADGLDEARDKARAWASQDHGSAKLEDVRWSWLDHEKTRIALGVRWTTDTGYRVRTYTLNEIAEWSGPGWGFVPVERCIQNFVAEKANQLCPQ
jgi:hypothetical protein